jgi:hypothetical protein
MVLGVVPLAVADLSEPVGEVLSLPQSSARSTTSAYFASFLTYKGARW